MIYLYHGSNVKIETIDLKKSRPNKDFSRGFYLSADREQAWRMGEFKALTEGGEPVMNTYTFDETQLTARMIQILTEEKGYSLEEAFERVYTSPIYEKLSDARTGLFFQSPRYVLSYLG